jgi:hypothetical protein
MRYAEERAPQASATRWIKRDSFDWDLAYRRAVEALKPRSPPPRK